jgi:hypothetical protein
VYALHVIERGKVRMGGGIERIEPALVSMMMGVCAMGREGLRNAEGGRIDAEGPISEPRARGIMEGISRVSLRLSLLLLAVLNGLGMPGRFPFEESRYHCEPF